jgi:hypothetical protein
MDRAYLEALRGSRIRIGSNIRLPEGGHGSKVTVTRHKPEGEVTVTRMSIHEYVATQRPRYLAAARREKPRILDEVVGLTRYHRKAGNLDDVVWVPRGTVDHIRNDYSPCEQCGYADDGPSEWSA